MDNRSKMPCFNPEDVMFLTNKWDIIEPKEYSSTDEEDNTEKENQHTETFRSINMKLKMGWPHINPKNIFRISIRQADE